MNAPGPIRSMEIETIGLAMFKISWTHVVDSGLGNTANSFNNTDRPINQFKLQICQDPVRDFTILHFEQKFPGTTFTFSKYDFLGGRNYTFRVLAYNDAGEGTPSVGITRPAISLPSEPLDFRAIVNVPLQISLFWVFPLDTGFGNPTTVPLEAYIINISSSATGFTEFQEVTLPGNALAWNHTGLTKGTIYFYQIQSKTNAGLSEIAPNATEMAISAPGVPRNFSIKVDLPLVIKVSWASPEDTGMGATSATPRRLTGYVLRVASSPASVQLTDFNLSTATFTLIPVVPSVTNYVLTGLQKGFRYYMNVFSTNSAGRSLATEYLRDRGIRTPEAVTNVSAVVPGPFAIYVSWKINDDSGLGPGLLPDQLLANDGLRVDMSANFSDFRNSTLLYLGGTYTSYTFTGLIKGVQYFFRIFSKNRAGVSVSWAVVTVRAIDVLSVPPFFTL